MPFALITIGLVIFVTALNGTFRQFGSQVYKDLFTNSPPFILWAAALVVVGLIGYIPKVKKPADWFMVLIIIGIILSNKGFFAQLQQALQHPSGINPATGVNTTTQTSGSGLLSNPVGSISNLGSQYQSFLNLFNGTSNNSTPLTTPAPIPGGTPLGQGGIGSA